ncbi:MAG: uracil-DNA glycosylase [Mariprofundaceae bacterium]
MVAGDSKLEQTRPECMRCRHYYVTWDPNFPYGCKAFGFKSRVMPCLEVYSASQHHCLKFEGKNRNQHPSEESGQ